MRSEIRIYMQNATQVWGREWRASTRGCQPRAMLTNKHMYSASISGVCINELILKQSNNWHGQQRACGGASGWIPRPFGHQSGSKRRWTYEDKVLVARAEVELSGCESLNARLSLTFPERTFQVIKGLRKNPAYHALVNELCSEGDRQMPDTSPVEIIPVCHPRVRPKVAPGCQPARKRQSCNWRRLVVRTREHLVFHRRKSRSSLVWLLPVSYTHLTLPTILRV